MNIKSLNTDLKTQKTLSDCKPSSLAYIWFWNSQFGMNISFIECTRVLKLCFIIV